MLTKPLGAALAENRMKCAGISEGFDMRRVLFVLTAVTTPAVPTSVAAGLLSTPAGAARPATTPVLVGCNKVSGNIHGTITFKGKKCSDKAPAGYGNLTVPVCNAGSCLFTGAPWQWSNGDYLEVNVNGATTSAEGCPHNWTENIINGPVDATSGDAYDESTLSEAGGTYLVTVCVNNSNGAVKGVRNVQPLMF
jgi:hypothetical protein